MNLPFRPGDKAVAYCRYSGGEEQGLKNTSTEEQEAAIRKFCEQNGIILVKVYADPFVSGRSVKGRDHYLEMMSDLLKKRIPGVHLLIVWDWERYGRNYNQAQLDAARLRMAGYKIWSMQQPIMDDGPFAHVLEAMYLASAQNQSDMISADVKRALQSNFKKYKVIPRSSIPKGFVPVPVDMGLFRDGTPRVGYRMEPDPAYKEKFRRAFEMRLEGASTAEIRAFVGIWESSTEVLRNLKKPLFYGCFSYGDTTMEDYCEPVVDRETFEKVQIYNREHPVRCPGYQGGWSHERALLSGLCFCAECGNPVYIDRRRAKGHLYETYRCNQKHGGIRAEILDDLVLRAAHELLAPERVESDKQQLLRDAPDPDPDNSYAIAKKIKELEKKIDNLTEAVAGGGKGLRSLLAKLDKLEQEKDDLEVRLASISESPKESRHTIEEAIEQTRRFILDILDDPESTTDDKRAALSLIILRVDINREGSVKISHCLPGCGKFRPFSSAPPEGMGGKTQQLNDVYQIEGLERHKRKARR